MMRAIRNIARLSALVGLMASTALADEAKPTETASPAAAPAATPAAPPATSIPTLATLVAPGERPDPGDMIQITRLFGGWDLQCEYRLSKNKRLCSVEQQLATKGSALVWRIATGTDNRAVMVISTDPRMVAAKGMKMNFSELEKSIPEKEWLCGPSACMTAFVFEGFIQSAVANAQSIRFTYTINSGAGEDKIELVGPMAGFSQAVRAGATDPFGKTAVQAPPQPAKADRKPPAKPEAKAEIKEESSAEKVSAPKPQAPKRQASDQPKPPTRTQLY